MAVLTTQQKRQKVLGQVGAELIKRAKKLADPAAPLVFPALIDNLQDFVARTNEYIDDFIKSAGKKGYQEALDKYPEKYVRRVIVNQVGHDLSVMEQAIAQREIPMLRKSLKVADILAQRLLQPAVEKGLFKGNADTENWANAFQKPLVFTYFQKSPSMRVIPYAPVALVGIPYTCASIGVPNTTKEHLIGTPNAPSPFLDFLAVPHEIGHYVFRAGRMRNRREGESSFIFRALLHRIQAQALEIPAYMERWTEEAFADTYGCLVAGPFIAFDFQDYLFDNYTSEDFHTNDDGDHPLPVLRPEIYEHTLKKMLGLGKAPNDWAGHLSARWADKKESRHPPKEFDTFKAGKGSMLNATKRLEQLRLEFEDVLEGIDMPQDLSASLPPVIDYPTKPNLVEDVYTQWDKWVDTTLRKGHVPTTTLRANLANALSWKDLWNKDTWHNWKDYLVKDSLTSAPLDGPHSKDLTDAEREWRVVINALSWTTEGPDQDPPKGI